MTDLPWKLRQQNRASAVYLFLGLFSLQSEAPLERRMFSQKDGKRKSGTGINKNLISNLDLK